MVLSVDGREMVSNALQDLKAYIPIFVSLLPLANVTFFMYWQSSKTLSSIVVIFAGIILLIDIYNIPSSVLIPIPTNARIIIVGLSLSFVILALYNGHFEDLYKFPTVTIMDHVGLCAMCVSIICTLAWKFWLNQYTYKFAISVGFSIMLTVCVICRRLFLYHRREESSLKRNNLYDLKEIYEGTFETQTQTPIFISEKAVNYDLLNRGGIINHLYRSISTCKSDSTFVIGLEGEWGSGKTTIINNVKEKLKKEKDVIIIDDIDPWLYGTQEALLIAMYDSILRATGIKYSIFHEKRVIKNLSNMVQNLLLPRYNDYGSVTDIKGKLYQYIKKSDKRVVFFIDNMDRAESSNIILVMKLINTIFALPNTIYVLSYDRNRLNEIMRDITKINPRYIEKIINQEMQVPMPQKNQIEIIYTVCIYNILKCYGIKEEELYLYKRLAEVVCVDVFASVFFQDNNLYKRDLLSLEVIRFLRPALYDQINKNRKFFVSHDRILDRDIYYESLNKEKFNEEGKDFYLKLFDINKEYKWLLIEMFPYAKRAADNNELQSDYYSDMDYAEISRNARICSEKYFDLYFSYGSNEYLLIRQEVAAVIDRIVKFKDKDQLYNYLCNQIIDIPNDVSREWFEQVENNIMLIPVEKRYVLAKAIFECLKSVDSSPVFIIGLDAKKRAILVIEKLLEEIDINQVGEFADDITEEYSKLYAIDRIIYWFQHTHSQHMDDMKERELILSDKFSTMCEKIIKENINLYEDIFYERYNIWGLLRYLKIKENREEIVHTYIAKIINEKNIFRIIADTIVQSMGKGYGYRIDDAHFKLFFEDEYLIDSLLEKAIPQSESEGFVLRVYQKYKSDEPNIWGEMEIFSPTEIKIEL